MSQAFTTDRRSLVHDSLNPFAGLDVNGLLEARANAQGSRTWLVWRDFGGSRREWSYSEFLEDVCSVASGLTERGVVEASRVCMFVENCPDFLIMWFAVMRLGAVMVSINARYKASELADAIERAEPAVLLTSLALMPTAVEALARLKGRAQSGRQSNGPHLVVADIATSPSTGAGWMPVEGLSALQQAHGASGAASARAGVVRSLAPAGVQFTSGTTARPKAVVWTQANYLWGAKVSASHESLTESDRHLVHLPLFHTNAQIYSVMATLWAGGSLVLVPRFSTSRFWQVAVEERVTWCSMVPFTVKALRRQPVPDHAIRAFGNALLVPSWDRYFGVSTVAWWGMTETVTHPIVSDPSMEGHALAIGRPACEYEIRVSDDEGQSLDRGVGSLEVRGVRGVSLALGYLDDPAATASVWSADGWMRTGDRVEVHDDGWLSFVERQGDMLKVGGENVAALEIERVVAAVPGVEEVAVVAAPDPMLDEIPVAFVVVDAAVSPAESEMIRARIREACSQELSSFKVPREIYLVEEMPRATLEKVAKAELREYATRLRDGA
ncbi:AMP-binding protein [Acidiferrimicrobium sp. IK]|uniref:AMP-binding protein n=1 Tax=Acidiferrimicrobium sp. IK TaxID=2871700 RepID=UPI0021CB802A|nr:AMP-binding protein [Acidiferrimicrobium sp. IK]MCU4183831.1 AMP-binding protein [Acidiferrimicrobium sp. IK]